MSYFPTNCDDYLNYLLEHLRAQNQDHYFYETDDWEHTCAHDAAWFKKNSKTNPRSHHVCSKKNTPEWWFKNHISIIWDPITETYIYHNKNTGLTFEDTDEALLEEELPVLEIDENRVDTRLRLYPHITAIYNVGTDSYWYYDSHWGTYHFTLNRALTPWDLPKYPKVSTPTHSRGLGMMYDPEYEQDELYPEENYPETNYDFPDSIQTNKGPSELTPSRLPQDWLRFGNEPSIGEVTVPHDEDEDFERYYGREAQKRDEAYSDYVDFLDGF